MTDELIKDILQWDVKSWSKALDYWDQKINWDKIKIGLELGGRQGGLSLWLALKGKTVVCSDLNEIAAIAEPLHKKYNISSNIKYEEIDAANIPYENYFDVVVFKSIIGGIGRNNNSELQQMTFNEIHKALKPGGKLLFAENLTASPIHRWMRRRFVDWGDSWRYVSMNEIKIFLNKYSSVDLHTAGFLGAFGRTERQRKYLSLFDQLIFNRLCPGSWKYIVYGIAEK